MLHIVLYQPEIPPNTGNIMRLAANTGFQLHLIEPLGFTLEEKLLRRAGLDYRDQAATTIYKNFHEFLTRVEPKRVFCLSTKGEKYYHQVEFESGDAVMFGPETRGLPRELMESLGFEHVLRLPMQADSRSLNLSNTCAVVVYEVLRQWGFPEML